VTSVRMLTASPLAAPRCSAAAAALSSSLSAIITLAPACESRSAIAYPMPDAPPVTKATLSLSSKNTLPPLPHVLVCCCPGVLKAYRPVGPRGLVDRERDAQRLNPLSPAHQRLRLAMLHGGDGPFGRPSGWSPPGPGIGQAAFYLHRVEDSHRYAFRRAGENRSMGWRVLPCEARSARTSPTALQNL